MIQIAIMGLGTVGTGVAKVVAENARQIERKLGEPLQVKTILVRHFKDGPYRQLMTDDFTRIEEDDAIRVVVETIGGVEAAYEYTKRALNAGKHVVTANKQLVAERGLDLKEVQDRVAEFLIEFEGVVKVMTGYTLTHAAFGEGVNGRVQRSFSHKRSGDVMFVIRPTWSPETREVEDTNFRYSRRYRVPLFFYGRGVKPGAWGRCGVEDVLPTLCGVMGITPPPKAECSVVKGTSPKTSRAIQ